MRQRQAVRAVRRSGEPMVSTGEGAGSGAPSGRPRAISMRRPAGLKRAHQEDHRRRAGADGEARAGSGARQGAVERRQLGEELAGLSGAKVRPPRSFSWLARMVAGDAAGEADGHRVRDVAGSADPSPNRRRPGPASARRPARSAAGPRRRTSRVVAATSTMKAPGRPADLKPAAAQRRRPRSRRRWR